MVPINMFLTLIDVFCPTWVSWTYKIYFLLQDKLSYLPEAHTCFNQLVLPDYQDKVIYCFLPNELSLCNKLWFSNPYILSTQCRRPHIYFKLQICSIKWSKFEISKVYTIRLQIEIGIRKFEFVIIYQYTSLWRDFVSSDSALG